MSYKTPIPVAFPLFYQCVAAKNTSLKQSDVVNILLRGAPADAAEIDGEPTDEPSIDDSKCSLYISGSRKVTKPLLTSVFKCGHEEIVRRMKLLHLADIDASIRRLIAVVNDYNPFSSEQNERFKKCGSSLEEQYDYLAEFLILALNNTKGGTRKLNDDELTALAGCGAVGSTFPFFEYEFSDDAVAKPEKDASASAVSSSDGINSETPRESATHTSQGQDIVQRFSTYMEFKGASSNTSPGATFSPSSSPETVLPRINFGSADSGDTDDEDTGSEDFGNAENSDDIEPIPEEQARRFDPQNWGLLDSYLSTSQVSFRSGVIDMGGNDVNDMQLVQLWIENWLSTDARYTILPYRIMRFIQLFYTGERSSLLDCYEIQCGIDGLYYVIKAFIPDNYPEMLVLAELPRQIQNGEATCYDKELISEPFEAALSEFNSEYLFIKTNENLPYDVVRVLILAYNQS